MNIRPASVADLQPCERLDGSYVTDHVWHMDESLAPGCVGATFQRVRVPRTMAVEYPRRTDDLLADWKRSECFLVADDSGVILGYLDMVVTQRAWQGWIKHLVVHRAYRRQSVATLLLQGAERWARGSGLSAVTAVLQTKNDPAIGFFSKQRYSFAGFIDHYFDNGDIGVLYSLRP